MLTVLVLIAVAAFVVAIVHAVAAEGVDVIPHAGFPFLEDVTPDIDIRLAIVERAPNVVDRWQAEDALSLAENPDSTREQLQAALAMLQRSIDNPETEGAPDDEPTLL